MTEIGGQKSDKFFLFSVVSLLSSEHEFKRKK